MSDLNIAPLGHRVLLEIAPIEEVTTGGIILPENKARDIERCLGTIVAIGPNAWKAFDDGEPWASIGDQVLYSKFSGKRVNDPDNPDRDFVVLNDDDLICVYKKPIKEYQADKEE